MRLKLVLSAVLIAFAAQAHAVTLKLSYQGADMPHVSGPPDPGRPFYPAFFGDVVLSEAAYGQSFANSTVQFYGINGPGNPANQTAGIVSWGLSFPLYAVAGSSISFTFGPAYQLQSWSLDALDGPPDYIMGTVFDTVLGGERGTYRVAASSWSVSQVPLPGAAGLLGVALLGLGALRRRG
ncbi:MULTISPECIES: hypothetical protein [unclassified Meridianimarinicoccus]|uniref:hypothetical protein n=1 Tax=unclassified Meridianimarinicoccus TaxID=2923344 RepID=UPI001868DE5F|nr:hypothetical protein [Fluviibacterium sp. MJW13]